MLIIHCVKSYVLVRSEMEIMCFTCLLVKFINSRLITIIIRRLLIDLN